MANAVGTNHSLNGGWLDRLRRFHREGNKTDYFGGSYNPNVIVSALNMINGDVEALEFPAKSYIVAICYADYISKQYDNDFYSVLSHPQLLHDDDHFTPYNEETAVVYDTLIPAVLTTSFKATVLYSVIIGYCKEELGEI